MVQQLIYNAGLIVILIIMSACRGTSPASSSGDKPSASESSELPISDGQLTSQLESPRQDGPPPPPSSAFIALLSPEQTSDIAALGISVVVPTAIPAGFLVEQVERVEDETFTSYRILYRDNSDRCFLVEYAEGGIGDIPATEYRIPIKPPLFDDGEDYGLSYGNYADTNLREQFPEPELMSDWLPLDNGVYRLAGAAYINDRLAPSRPCQDVSLEEAVQIVESFALITDEIIGDS